MVQNSDMLEIRLKDASYRTYYKIRVPVADKRKLAKIITDLKIIYGIDLTEIKIDENTKAYNLFGEPLDNSEFPDDDEPLVW